MMKNIGPLQFGANFCLEQSFSTFSFYRLPKEDFLYSIIPLLPKSNIMDIL